MHNFTQINTYRTEFLRSNRFYQSDGFVMEDFEHTPRVWFAARSMAYLDEALYIYRRRANSLTTEASSRIASHVVRQVKSLLEFYSSRDIPSDIRAI